MDKILQIPNKFKFLFDIRTDPKYKDIYYIIFRSGRGTGKTENIERFLITDSIANPDSMYVIYREFVGSNDYSTMEGIWNIICDLQLDNIYRRLGKGEIVRTDNHRGKFLFQGISTSTSTSRSVKGLATQNIRWVWVEEAQDLTEMSLNKMKNTIRGEDSKIIFSMNPTMITDPVYVLATSGSPYVLDVPLKVEDNPFFAEKSKIDMELDRQIMSPALFSWTWEGNFLDAESNSLFSGELIQRCREYRNELSLEGESIIMGVDYSSIGEDKTAVTIRKGNCVLYAEYIEVDKIKDISEQVCMRILHLQKLYQVEHIVYDADGVGAELRNSFIRYGIEGTAFRGGDTALDSNYFNRRSEVYFKLQRIVQAGLDFNSIQTEQREIYLNEMGRILYNIDSSKMRIIEKSVIRKLLKHSPDMLDSLCYSLAFDYNKKTYKRGYKFEI